MKKYSKIFAIVLALIMAFSLAACNNAQPAPEPEAPVAEAPAEETPEPEAAPTHSDMGIPFPNGDYRVVFTMFNGENPVARAIESGYIKAAESVNLNLWVMDNMLDPIQMNANADLAISAGDVDYYVLYTNDIASNPQIMDKLVPAGIPVYTIATEAIASDGTTAPLFFSPDDNYDSAFLAGAAVAQAAKDKGWTEDEIIYLSMGFLEAGGVFLIRTEGALAGVQSVFPGISLDNGNYIETSSTGSAEVAHQRTQDFLTTMPADKKLISWTHSDDVTGTMMAAIQTAGRTADSLIVSNGLTENMLGLLRDPDSICVGMIDLRFPEWGTIMLTQIIDNLNDGTPIPDITNAPFTLVTPANVDQYYPQ